MRTLLVSTLLVSSLALAGCGEDFTVPATGTIYGDLFYESGQPASGIDIIVEGTDLRGVTNSRGRFVINGVLAVDEEGMGKYYVVRGEGMLNGKSIAFFVDRFKVKGQQSYSVGRLTVRETGVIKGRLRLMGSGDHSGVRVSIRGTSLETLTRADGTFTLDKVPAYGGYEIPCIKSGFQDMTIDHAPGEPGRDLVVDPGQTLVFPQMDMQRSE